jgi:putative ABC transport system permease protein
MRIQDLAQLSTRAFKTNPMRTWLTILGMGVGTGAVVVLVGLGFGLQQIILEQIVFGETLLSLGVSATGAQNLKLTSETVLSFEQKENVLDAAPLARFPALVTYKGLTGNVFIQGVEPAYLRYAGITATAGNVFLEADVADENSVMLSPAVLKLFGVEDIEGFVGQKVKFRILVPVEGSDEINEVLIDKEYTVRGITKEEGVLNALMMIGELRNHVGIEEFERIQVRVADNESLPIIEESLIADGYRVTALSKTVEQASKIFQGVQIVLATFGGIALLVSAIGMFNTMTVTLLERTKEIGIMRTLGASPSDIKWLFVSESIVVGFLGGVSGIVMGVTLGVSINLMLNVLASQFGGQAVALFAFPIWFLAFIAIFSAGVGYLTGIFPARRASALNPLDAIRYE